MEVKHKGLLTKMSRGRSKSPASSWKERYFELSVSKIAHSYILQYSKGPGKKALGEIRLDQTSRLGTSSRIHSGTQCLVLTTSVDELHFHAKTEKEQKSWEEALNTAISDTCRSADQRANIDKHLQQKDAMLESMDALRDSHRRQQQYIHVLEQENNDLNEMLQRKELESAGVGGVVAAGGLKEQLQQKVTENAKLQAEVARLTRIVERLTAQVNGNASTAKAEKSAPTAGMTFSYTVKIPEKSGFDDSDDSDDSDGAPPPPPSP